MNQQQKLYFLTSLLSKQIMNLTFEHNNISIYFAKLPAHYNIEGNFRTNLTFKAAFSLGLIPQITILSYHVKFYLFAVM